MSDPYRVHHTLFIFNKTTSGAENSGLIIDVHYKHADNPEAFAQSVQQLLSDKQMAHAFVQRAQAFIAEHSNQAEVLEKLLLAT